MIKVKRGDNESTKVGKVMAVRTGRLPRSGFVHLAIFTGSNISILITYIVFVTKMQKRQIFEKGSALFKNDITTSEPTFKTTDT